MNKNRKISKVLEFIEKEPRTENEIKNFLSSSFELSNIGVENYFKTLFNYDLLIYDENGKLELGYTLWYMLPKTMFVPHPNEKRAITRVRKTNGTLEECKLKRKELMDKLNVPIAMFVIE
ncbi:MAG: hypothetical protein ACPGXZ_12305 [Saprospiraceae bacterium]